MIKRFRHHLIAFSGCVMFLASGAPADAQVFVDPGSPSGKEYEIPLETARRNAAGDGDLTAVPNGDRSSPLFGAGVGDGAASGATDGPSSASSERQKPAVTGSDEDPPSRRIPSRASSVEEAIGSVNDPVGAAVPQSGVGGVAPVVALALSVLLLGGVIGSLARRRRST